MGGRWFLLRNEARMLTYQRKKRRNLRGGFQIFACRFSSDALRWSVPPIFSGAKCMKLFNMWRGVFTSRHIEEQSQGIWVAVENYKSSGCQEQETWRQFSEDRYSTWANAWPVMICTLSMWSSCLPGAWPQQGRTAFVHFFHRTRPGPASHQFTECLVPAPDSSLQAGEWNNLAAFTGNPHASILW